jgi:hypothetical protein
MRCHSVGCRQPWQARPDMKIRRCPTGDVVANGSPGQMILNAVGDNSPNGPGINFSGGTFFGDPIEDLGVVRNFIKFTRRLRGGLGRQNYTGTIITLIDPTWDGYQTYFYPAFMICGVFTENDQGCYWWTTQSIPAETSPRNFPGYPRPYP